MKRLIIGIIVGFLIGGSISYAKVIGSPPPDRDISVSLANWFTDVYNNFNKLDVLTATPNGVRNGTDGQIVLFNDGGTYKLFTAVGTGTVWQQL